MTTQDLIKYLRLNVSVVDPDSGESDKLYLKLTDDDLRLYLDMARTRAFYDESLDFADDLQPNESYTKNFYLLYEEDGTYVIEFNNYEDQIKIELDVKK